MDKPPIKAWFKILSKYFVEKVEKLKKNNIHYNLHLNCEILGSWIKYCAHILYNIKLRYIINEYWVMTSVLCVF
jgi:hypothetical protein